ncbi:MAG: Crp/Fnr family transcriptional regulator [Burkholderiaceae bacterium]
MFAKSVWWQTLAATQQDRVRRDAQVKLIPANAFVCREGEAPEYWPGVASGLVKLSTGDATGRTATLAGVPSGGWFGEGSLLKCEHRRYGAIALRDSQIVFVPAQTFSWLLDNSIGFNRFVLHQLNERLSHFIGSVEHQRLLNPEGRLARCLAQMFNPFLFPGVEPTFPFSQQELGQLTGLSRQRVNRALQILENEGLVSVRYGAIQVESVAGLSSYPGPPEPGREPETPALMAQFNQSFKS